MLDDLGLLAALEWLAEETSRRHGFTVDLSVDEPSGSLAEPLASQVYRIVQEGLTNAGRHAAATRVRVALRTIGPSRGGLSALFTSLNRNKRSIAIDLHQPAGVALLDRHSDLDHNRTVLTFAGPPPAIEEAAFRSIAKAAELINLDEHRGEHPRIGATDVVPFVPISGLNMQDCVEIARRLGRRVGETPPCSSGMPG